MRFYAENLFNPHWGEQIAFEADNTVQVFMVSQGLDQAEAEGLWKPFMASLTDSPKDFAVEAPLSVLTLSARRFWDAEYLARNFPGLLVRDDRPDAPSGNVFYAGDGGQVGFFLHAYKSAWLPASLLAPAEQQKLVDAIFAATRHWKV